MLKFHPDEWFSITLRAEAIFHLSLITVYHFKSHHFTNKFPSESHFFVNISHRWVEFSIALCAEEACRRSPSDDNTASIYRMDLKQACSSVEIRVKYCTKQSHPLVLSFTYYMEFGLQSLVSVHPYRSVGATLLWQRKGASVGPPAPIRWQFEAPGPVAAPPQLRPGKTYGQWKR